MTKWMHVSTCLSIVFFSPILIEEGRVPLRVLFSWAGLLDSAVSHFKVQPSSCTLHYLNCCFLFPWYFSRQNYSPNSSYFTFNPWLIFSLHSVPLPQSIARFENSPLSSSHLIFRELKLILLCFCFKKLLWLPWSYFLLKLSGTLFTWLIFSSFICWVGAVPLWLLFLLYSP